MQLPESWSQMRREVLAPIKPTPSEEKAMHIFVDSTLRKLEEALFKAGVSGSVEVHGSVAHGTWLKDERDVDIFIIIDPSMGRKGLLRVNEVVKSFVDGKWVEAYAEHPYIKAKVEGFDVEFVPCFRVALGEKPRSSADRTPLHTGFLKGCLTGTLRDDVRILKRFIRNIDVYGAEIRVGGFSGYLCELLIIVFGSFESVIGAASLWGEPSPIDVVRQRDEKILRKKFSESLIIVDPIDEDRNTASAVSEYSLYTFSMAARSFIKKPAKEFFFSKKTQVTPTEVLGAIKDRGTDLIFLIIPDREPPVPDTLWGQLYRAEKSIARAMSEADFRVLRSAAWSDEKSKHLLIFELEDAELSSTVKKTGPPAKFVKDSDSFVSTYINSPTTISGPGLEDGYWWVEVKRRYYEASTCLLEMLHEKGEDIGIPQRLVKGFRKGGKVLENREIRPYLTEEFTMALDKFLKGRPDWLE